ncbi:ABC transporter substrate-binding protein [Paralcaligenes ureilyticus]|uniref:Peptide/nickel transport system substrate-binding protein n=1 Tax=Paralcaligenes ureilyticus TaxID=627131 RepID=A0A4R3LZD3_9BURK|nr:ABC transporter substrate-binding protein [Paralcaligenes ureilyticus]TCT04117.1 peptide/nickel transport system substrate-binding protein [Paralcaligenes ureilyticus]
MQSSRFSKNSLFLEQHSPARRKILWMGAAGLSAAVLAGNKVFAAGKDQSASLAMIGDPQTLDPMLTTADLVGTIMQHVYEPLYTFDAKWNVVPMLAVALPVISDDGKVFEIALREGVNFHNGQKMTAEDVVASLDRWSKISPRGKAVAKEIAEIKIISPSKIAIHLNNRYAPLLAQLAFSSSMAAIMPKSTIAAQLTQFIGTGPYKLKERRPDQYTILDRFDSYSARTEAPSGYGGRRTAVIKELRFVPVPDSNTRVEGALSGQFAYADLLPVESVKRVERGGASVVPIITKNFGFPYLVFNTKEGTLQSQPMRQAAQTAMGTEELLAAAFGDPRFFIVEPNFFPKGTPYYSDAGAGHYNNNDPKKAAELAKKAGYANKPIRILASRQYEFHYNIAMVLVEQFKRAGLATDLQVVDWATLLQRRNDAKLWDIYITHSGLFPEPMLSPPQLGSGAPGWWESPEKAATIKAFNDAVDLNKRGPLWGAVQKVVYDQVPFVELGKFNSLSARSSKLQNFVPGAWPFFWNATLA